MKKYYIFILLVVVLFLYAANKNNKDLEKLHRLKQNNLNFKKRLVVKIDSLGREISYEDVHCRKLQTELLSVKNLVFEAEGILMLLKSQVKDILQDIQTNSQIINDLKIKIEAKYRSLYQRRQKFYYQFFLPNIYQNFFRKMYYLKKIKKIDERNIAYYNRLQQEQLTLLRVKEIKKDSLQNVSKRLFFQKKEATRVFRSHQIAYQKLQEKQKLQKKMLDQVYGNLDLYEELIRQRSASLKDLKKRLSKFKMTNFQVDFFKGMQWDLAIDTIIRPFGISMDKKLWVKSDNPGIDIKCSQSSVLAVATGVVSEVFWMTGMGNTIIINHGNGYFSVYSKLSLVSVKNGDKISKSQEIGFLDKDQLLHLELWYKNKKLNPEKWLQFKNK